MYVTKTANLSVRSALGLGKPSVKILTLCRLLWVVCTEVHEGKY